MKYLNFGLALLILILILFPFLVLPRLIKINKVICASQYGPCPEEIKTEAEGLTGKTLFEIKKELENKYGTDKKIQEFSFYYQIPQTVKINLVLKKAAFAIKNEGSEVFRLLTKDGEAIAEVNETNLPVLIGTDANLFALKLLNGLNYAYQIKTGEIKENSFFISLPEGITVIFPLEGDSDLLLGSLKLILSRLNDASVKSKIVKVLTIDLRYKNPIIR